MQSEWCSNQPHLVPLSSSSGLLASQTLLNVPLSYLSGSGSTAVWPFCVILSKIVGAQSLCAWSSRLSAVGFALTGAGEKPLWRRDSFVELERKWGHHILISTKLQSSELVPCPKSGEFDIVLMELIECQSIAPTGHSFGLIVRYKLRSTPLNPHSRISTKVLMIPDLWLLPL